MGIRFGNGRPDPVLEDLERQVDAFRDAVLALYDAASTTGKREIVRKLAEDLADPHKLTD